MLATLKRICRPTFKQDQNTAASWTRAASARDMRRPEPMSFREKMRHDPFERLAKI